MTNHWLHSFPYSLPIVITSIAYWQPMPMCNLQNSNSQTWYPNAKLEVPQPPKQFFSSMVPKCQTYKWYKSACLLTSNLGHDSRRFLGCQSAHVLSIRKHLRSTKIINQSLINNTISNELPGPNSQAIHPRRIVDMYLLEFWCLPIKVESETLHSCFGFKVMINTLKSKLPGNLVFYILQGLNFSSFVGMFISILYEESLIVITS